MANSVAAGMVMSILGYDVQMLCTLLKNQFAKKGGSPDCSECHTLQGFNQSTFTIERHNSSKFQLSGAHLATPCFACHKRSEKWSFREIGEKCIDCHKNIHEPYLDKKYYPGASCISCHNSSRWNEILFNQHRFSCTCTTLGQASQAQS